MFQKEIFLFFDWNTYPQKSTPKCRLCDRGGVERTVLISNIF